LSERRFRWRALCALTSVVLISLLATAQSAPAAGGATVEDVVQAIHSFQQLAVLDPSTAGEVWMEGRVASNWDQVVGTAIDDRFEATILFGHLVPFAAADESGVRAGLYNPWIGLLVLLAFDPLATAVESCSVHAAEALGSEAADPLAFATEAMAAIDAAYDAFAGAAAAGEELSARDLGDRIDEATKRLGSVYGHDEADTVLADAIDRLFAEELTEPLTVFGEESEAWMSSLLPLWTSEADSWTFVVLASMASPLDWAWLEIGHGAGHPIDSASVIRLYDRIVSQGGDGT